MQNETTPNSENRQSSKEDWREQRRIWRHQRRENRRSMYPLHGLFLGLTLILLGTLFFLNQTGFISGNVWWQSLLIGLGAIFIIDGTVHYFNPVYSWASYGKFIAGIVLILTGSLFILGFGQWWPLLLVVAGVSLLIRIFWNKI